MSTLSQNGYGAYNSSQCNGLTRAIGSPDSSKKRVTKKSRDLQMEIPAFRLLEKEEQIVGTQEKSQQIVAQRLLSCLQYLDATKSSAKDLSQSSINL